MMGIAVADLIAGIVIFLLSLPLIKRRVPKNDFYGFRIRESFQSEQHWYEINEHGGRLFAGWSLLIVAAGVAGLFIPSSQHDNYVLACLIAAPISVIVPTIQTIKWARKKKTADGAAPAR